MYALRRGWRNGRSAELVGVAQPIVRCGECGGVGRRGEVSQGRVWALAIVVGDPCSDLGPCIVEIEEQCLIQELVAHPAIEALDEGILDRLAWRNEMPVSLHQASMALQVNSVPLSETIEPGAPRRATIAVSSRATRRPESDVSGIAPKHSLVTSSTMLRTRKRRPLANWS